MPGGGFDHAEVTASVDFIEVVYLTDHGFEAELGLVDELVLVEGVNHLQVGLAQFDELLLQLTFHARDASAFKVG